MSQVKATNNIKGTGKNTENSARKAFKTVSTDIQRVSSDASPRDTGFLEKNHLDIIYANDNWTATIWFRAFNKDFDYAKWTHEAYYNLGPRSVTKPGGNSKFTGHVPVGRRYLARTVDQGRAGYIEHLEKGIIDGISNK